MARKRERKTLPYTFARVSVMKSKLIDRDEYYKLLKMDLNSITRFLQESEYKESITKLSTRYSGIELLDHALRQNKVKTFDKLRQISPKSVVEIIDLYLDRWDFQNLKVVLRGLYSNADKEEVAGLIIAIGNHDKQFFVKLFELSSIWDALKSSKIVSEKEIKNDYEEFKRSNRLIDLENRLDQIYFNRAAKGSALAGPYGKEFRKFLLRDIDTTNIRNLIRFKRENLEPTMIMKYMIIEGEKLNRKKLESLARKESLKVLLESLKKTYYGKYVDFGDESLVDIEIALNNYNLKNASLRSHQNPMSISGIMTYMISKIIEIRNIRSIVKSKHLGVDADYVEKKLLIV